jgi:hypothetical protein
VHLLINLRWFICWRLAARQIIARGGMGVPVAGQGERTALIQSEARRDDPQRTPTCFARSYDSVRCLKRTGTKASAQHNSFMRYVPRQPRTVVCVLVRLGRHINRGGDDGTAGRGDPRGKLKQSSSHVPRSSYQAGHGRARVLVLLRLRAYARPSNRQAAIVVRATHPAVSGFPVPAAARFCVSS